MGIDRNRFSRKEVNWDDWLADEGAGSAPRSVPGYSAPVTPNTHRRNQENRAQATVSINIRLPHVRLPSKASVLRVGRWGIAASVWIGLAVVTRALVGVVADTGTKTAVKGAQTQQTPTFTAAKPTGNTSQSIQAYDPQRKLVSYTDKVSSADVTISQQQLPEKLKKDPVEVLKLADSLKATETVETAFGTAHIATDEKTGIQRVMMPYRDQLLIFLTSSKKLDPDAWKYYIESLR